MILERDDARQWSAGEVPKVEYNKDFETAYEVTKRTAKPAPGKARIQTFFTSKDNDVFAILPHWPGGAIEIQDVSGVKPVALSGSPAPVRFRALKGGVSVDPPEPPEEPIEQPAGVLKLSR